MYETMSISTGLHPNLDLWNANKLHYISLHYTGYIVNAYWQMIVDLNS